MDTHCPLLFSTNPAPTSVPTVQDLARLLEAAVPFAWRFWEFSWTPPTAPGRYTLQARATDRAGHTQPTAHDPDRRTYMVNKIGAVEVVVP